ncbi:hypothetical protein EU528_08835 [Candidatus Thorarchaeota archaeon]|nr:MAG: hypothetical protein EU528_08835 [Candidatus Thorarchaeota archaeon]
MFVCKKCKESMYVVSSEIRGSTLRLNCQCLKGHKEKRDLSRYQADSMGLDLFKGLFTCLECGSTMSLIHSDVGRKDCDEIFLCPIHGVIPKRIPSYYHNAVIAAKSTVNNAKSILDTLSCPKCGQIFSTHEVEEKKGVMIFKYRCPNGHKEIRYVPTDADPAILKTTFKRLIHCEQCGLPCKILDTSIKGEGARIEVSCPVHGKTRKEMPAKHAWMIEKIAAAVSEGSIVRSMLNCTECSSGLSIRSIELDKDKYKLKCSCPNGHTSEMTQPTELDEEAIDAIVAGVLKCNECDLTTDILSTKTTGSLIEFELVCPVHQVMKKGVIGGIYKHVEERESQIDKMDTVEKSLKCDKCPSVVTIKDTKIKDKIIELKVECRNGHSSERYVSQTAKYEELLRYYMQLFECYKCHGNRDLLRIDDSDGKTEVFLFCKQHKDSNLVIPPEHREAVRDAFVKTKSLRDLEILVDKTLQTKRACEYQMDANADATEMLEIIKNVIGQHSVLYVDEKTDPTTGLESWYYGKALDGDEYVVIGSASKENLSLRITIASNNEKKLEVMLAEMRENLREVLLRIQTKSDDSAPRKISCPQCNAGLAKRALPGETIICEHCGTPLHFG